MGRFWTEFKSHVSFHLLLLKALHMNHFSSVDRRTFEWSLRHNSCQLNRKWLRSPSSWSKHNCQICLLFSSWRPKRPKPIQMVLFVLIQSQIIFHYKFTYFLWYSILYPFWSPCKTLLWVLPWESVVSSTVSTVFLPFESTVVVVVTLIFWPFLITV